MSTAICKLIKAGHIAPKLLRYISGKSIDTTADLGFGVMRLPVSRVSWATKALLSFHGNSRACEARHVVFSLAKGMAKKEAVNLLRSIASDWLATYAPDRNWVLGIHSNTGIYHAHLAVANVGSDSKPLKFRPHQAVAMSKMKFTEHAISAKGIGKKGHTHYSKPRRKLLAHDLAELLFTPSGEINSAAWKSLETTGSIKNLRLRKCGTPISFEYAKRRIRFTTLRRYMLDQTQQKKTKNTMPQQIITPTTPLRSNIVAALRQVGFSTETLKKMSATLSTAHSLVSESQERSHSQKMKTPTLQ